MTICLKCYWHPMAYSYRFKISNHQPTLNLKRLNQSEQICVKCLLKPPPRNHRFHVRTEGGFLIPLQPIPGVLCIPRNSSKWPGTFFSANSRPKRRAPFQRCFQQKTNKTRNPWSGFTWTDVFCCMLSSLAFLSRTFGVDRHQSFVIRNGKPWKSQMPWKKMKK